MSDCPKGLEYVIEDLNEKKMNYMHSCPCGAMWIGVKNSFRCPNEEFDWHEALKAKGERIANQPKERNEGCD